jgi:transcription elongation factor Elf1
MRLTLFDPMRWLRRQRRRAARSEAGQPAATHRDGCPVCGATERVERLVPAHDGFGGVPAYVISCASCGVEVAAIRASAAA